LSLDREELSTSTLQIMVFGISLLIEAVRREYLLAYRILLEELERCNNPLHQNHPPTEKMTY
jgi:hypothetical protein